MKKLKTYNIGKNTTFDLNQIKEDLGYGNYTIKTQAVSVNGKKSPESVGIKYKIIDPNPLNLPPFTIRCKFKPNYTPTMGTSQTSVDHDNNVWDIKFESARELFYANEDLLEVIGANTSSVTDMYAMFVYCTSLTSVALFDTSSVENMNGMFVYCPSLTSVPLFDTSSVNSMNQMFSDCSSLTSIPLFDTSSVESMFQMISSCTSLKSVPLFDTSSVKNMDGMFINCTSLTSVPLFDTSAVTNMDSMFSGCTSLTSVPQFDTSSVTSMSNMFNGCTSLTIVPLFDTSKVVSVYRMFENCVKVESGAYAFYKQASRQKNPPSEYYNAFWACGSETESGRNELEKIPSDWGGEATPIEPRNIWIDFKFLEPEFNPQDAQLAVGTEESNGRNRAFKADWQLIDEDEHIWRWGVTEGTDLSLAFRYGGGEQSFPLIVAENYRDIPEEMWRQEGYSSLEAIVADCENWWTDEIKSGHIQFTGSAEVVGWDLINATSLDNLFGDNPYWRCAIVGTLPDLYSEAYHAVYMFGRLYDITSVGKITLPNLNGDIQKILFAMTSLQNIPEIELDRNPQNLDRLFWQDCNVSKSSIEAAYNYLNTNFGSLRHTATFTQCGLYKDPTALDNIPASWGGNA